MKASLHAKYMILIGSLSKRDCTQCESPQIDCCNRNCLICELFHPIWKATMTIFGIDLRILHSRCRYLFPDSLSRVGVAAREDVKPPELPSAFVNRISTNECPVGVGVVHLEVILARNGCRRSYHTMSGKNPCLFCYWTGCHILHYLAAGEYRLIVG